MIFAGGQQAYLGSEPNPQKYSLPCLRPYKVIQALEEWRIALAGSLPEGVEPWDWLVTRRFVLEKALQYLVNGSLLRGSVYLLEERHVDGQILAAWWQSVSEPAFQIDLSHRLERYVTQLVEDVHYRVQHLRPLRHPREDSLPIGGQETL